MINRKRYAALLLGLTMTFSAVSVATQPVMTTYAAAWEKNSAGAYVDGNGSTITGVLSRGIDVSHWKQTIDWNKVAADDVKFVMLGTRYNNDVDPYFGTNAIGAFNAGIKVGAYIYSYATSGEMAEAEADFVLDLIKEVSYDKVDAILVDGSVAQQYQATNEDLVALSFEELGNSADVCIAVQKGDPKGLLPKLNEAIAKLTEENKIEEFKAQANELADVWQEVSMPEE